MRRHRTHGRWHATTIGVMAVALAIFGSGCRDDGNDGYVRDADEASDATDVDGTPSSDTSDTPSDDADASDVGDAADTSDTSVTSDSSETVPPSDATDPSDTTEGGSQPPNGTVASGGSAATATTVGSTAPTSTQSPTTTQPPTTTLPPTTTRPPVDPGVAEFCAAFVTAETTFNRGPDIDFGNSTSEQIAAAVEAHDAALESLLTDAAATAPASIAPDVEAVVAMIRSSLASGDDLASDATYRAADERVDAFVADSCGYPTSTVSAVEYAFEGLPSSLRAGQATFAFTNNGAEIHEMVVFRINDDVTETIDELLALPEEEALAKVEFAGSMFGAQGETDIETLELTTGRYVALCFVPVGTTEVETSDGNDEPLGPPHFTEGMQATFTVS